MADPPPYQYGVSEFTTWPWSFEQDVERYAALAVDTIEVCEFKLDERRAGEQLALIAERGLRISSVQPSVRTLYPGRMQPEPGEPSERMARFRHSIASIAPFGRDLPFVTNTGNAPKGNIRQVIARAEREYRALADFAADHGARVALEPLNASTMNEESAIWTLQQAMRIVEAVDRPNFGVCVDLWNLWQNADILAALRACGERNFIVQVSDWQTPRSFADRFVIGQGEIPLAILLRAIYDGGYRGPYAVEIFSQDVPDSLYDGDLQQVIRDNRAGLDTAWREAFNAG
ncbi:MAG TPA: sugar phosphate isomerase/epimerase family protein [Chloroflexota bacterium]|jgi:sugar phosphate isomerase/epimerase|nr:sugar phosphate isomerase/epimerase family protein [Chloroflexota bacterium]